MAPRCFSDGFFSTPVRSTLASFAPAAVQQRVLMLRPEWSREKCCEPEGGWFYCFFGVVDVDHAVVRRELVDHLPATSAWRRRRVHSPDEAPTAQLLTPRQGALDDRVNDGHFFGM